MKKIADFCVLGTLTLSLCLAGVANAAVPPEECLDARDLRFFNLGVFKGVSLVNQAWASLGDDPCRADNVESFVAVVIAAFEAGTPASGSPETVWCHWLGSYLGSAERADELFDTAQCAGMCCDEGRMIGEMAATFYCELSIEFGGLGLDQWLVAAELTYCAENFVACCEEEFVNVTMAYPSQNDPQCLAYTPFDNPPYSEEVYNQTKHNQCIYEIEE
jgi:hypothetical protein